MFQFSGSSLARRHGVNQKLIDVSDRALEITLIDFGIPEHGGLRTEAEQRELFEAGKSQLDGYRRKSYHQTGRALDVYAYVDGQASWEIEHLAQVACAMFQAADELNVSIRYGGLWRSFTDFPHFELAEDE